MTDATKLLLTNLLAGCSIYGHQFGFHLRDMERKAFISKINPRTYRQVKRYLRKGKGGLFVIDKRKVRGEHGNSYIKKTYKKSNPKCG
jgi:hypothetical protein